MKNYNGLNEKIKMMRLMDIELVCEVYKNLYVEFNGNVSIEEINEELKYNNNVIELNDEELNMLIEFCELNNMFL